jgi:hypothetical protein
MRLGPNINGLNSGRRIQACVGRLRRITNTRAPTTSADSIQYSALPLNKKADATIAMAQTSDQTNVEVFMRWSLARRLISHEKRVTNRSA